MPKQKPEHYGISNDKDVREINWALRTFVERVRDGDEIPEHLLHFIADGVERYLKDGQPWSKARDKTVDNQGKVALMKFILEQGGTQQQIADHLGVSKGRVSQMLKSNSQPIESALHKHMWTSVFKGKRLADILNALSEDYGKGESLED